VEAGVTTTDRGDGWWDRPFFPFGLVLLQLLTNPGTALMPAHPEGG
jgi:hypothetical protein